MSGSVERPEADALLAWRDLSVSFAGRTLFRGLSGCLRPGERVRVTGPSGSGKTTFLRLLLGFVNPDAGAVSSVRDLRDLAAYVPQEADFGAAQTAGEWLQRVFSYRRNRTRRASASAVAALGAQLLLPAGVLETSVTRISGGEKQRLALLAALLLPRDVLILDEPFSALDAAAADAAAAAIVRSGRAVLYASHVDREADFATREVSL